MGPADWAGIPSCLTRQILASLQVNDHAAARQTCAAWHLSHAEGISALVLMPTASGSVKLQRLAGPFSRLEQLDLRGLQHTQQSLEPTEMQQLLEQLASIRALHLPRGPAIGFAMLCAVAEAGSSLTSLTLHGLSSICPWALAMLGVGLQSLTHLDLSSIGDLSDQHLPHLQPLTKLSNLNLSGNPMIHGPGLAALSHLSLGTLGVSGMTATGLQLMAGVMRLNGCAWNALKEIDLGSNQQLMPLTVDIIVALAKLPSLEKLSIACRRCTTSVAKLGKVKTLRALDCSGSQDLVDDDALAWRGLANLETLCLSGCALISPIGLEALRCWTRLTTLNLEGCSRVSDGVLTGPLASCSLLQRLILRECRLLTDIGVSALSALWQLEVLVLEGCPLITDKGVAVGLSHLTKIRQLDLSRNAQLGHGTALALSRIPVLESVNMSHCTELGDKGLSFLAMAKSLTKLDVRCANQITDEGLTTLATCAGDRLVELRLGRCSGVTDAGLNALAKHCTRLEMLQLYRLNGISDLGVGFLKEAMPGVHLSMYKCSGVSFRDM